MVFILNPSKSEAIAFYNPRSKPLAALAESIGTVSVAGSPIKLQASIKNLGVYLDSTMSFGKQVSETGFRFATELVSKLLLLLLKCYSFSSHSILLHSSHVMYQREHSAPLHHCQFCVTVPPRKTTMATSKLFLSVASNIWNALPNHLSSIPTLPAFRRALKHHLFLLAYPDSSVKSGMTKPAQRITLCDTIPTTAIAQPSNTICRPAKGVPSSAYD